MLKEIAVTGLTLDHSPGSVIEGGEFTITSIASVKVKGEGKDVYHTQIAFTFALGDSEGFDPESIAGGGTIMATASKVRVETGFVMRVGDSGTLVAAGTVSGSPTAISDSVEITNANQTKVKAQ